jgi:hypothetical protein
MQAAAKLARVSFFMRDSGSKTDLGLGTLHPPPGSGASPPNAPLPRTASKRRSVWDVALNRQTEEDLLLVHLLGEHS